MRNKVIAGNWKMHKEVGESVQFVKELAAKSNSIPENAKVIICPVYTALYAVSEVLKGSKIKPIGIPTRPIHGANGDRLGAAPPGGNLCTHRCQQCWPA